MKLATLRDGSRDGQLAVVARDLKTAPIADGIAPTLQVALDDWTFIAPQLAALSEDVNRRSRSGSNSKRVRRRRAACRKFGKKVPQSYVRNFHNYIKIALFYW